METVNQATINMLSIDQIMQLAHEHQMRGELQQAEILLRNILEKNPAHAEAYHLYGIVAYQAGQLLMALEFIKKAINLNDRIGLYHSNYGEMCRIAKRYDEAIAHGEKAVELDPTAASTHSNLGVAYFDIKEFDKAQACQMRALSINPDFAQALNNMGSIARERKMPIEAMGYYERAFNASGRRYVEPFCNLGTLLIEEDRVEDAFPILAQVLAVQPNHPEALCSMGGAYLAKEDPRKAYSYFDKALAVDPNHATAWGGIARSFYDINEPENAITYIDKAIELDPKKDEFYLVRAQVKQELGQIDQAISDFDQVNRIKPEATKGVVAKARMFMELGDIDKTRDALNQALAIDPRDVTALAQLILTYKVKSPDENMLKLIDVYNAGELYKISDKIGLHFALGKCYEDIGDYDNSMDHYLKGNQLKRQTLDFDAQADEQNITNLVASFTKDKIKKLQSSGLQTSVPIFIVGMPRSGTTLVEQIISTHADMFGAGELHFLPAAITTCCEKRNLSVIEMMGSITSEMVHEVGEVYFNKVRMLDSKANHIIDKMPSNYLFLGLIHLAFPNAKIIHLQRNPIDVCLSGFFRLFHRGQFHSYDLVDSGKHYRSYALAMQHWRDVLPAGSFFDIQYEDLINDTETYARKLIDYCGLEWDDACLSFYDTKRTVKTASIMQVRQPIYKTSVEKWRRYEKYLDPLRQALGEFNPQ